MDENSLSHYGILGMKWGRRKNKSSKKSSSKKSSSKKKVSDIKKKIKNITSKVDKEKVKTIAKTTAKVAGSVAAVSILGYTGHLLVNSIDNTITGLREENAKLRNSNQFHSEQADAFAKSSVKNYDLANEQKLRADSFKYLVDNSSNINEAKRRVAALDFYIKDIPMVKDTVELKKRR